MHRRVAGRASLRSRAGEPRASTPRRATCLLVLASACCASQARALQPLAEFVASALQKNPDNLEAAASERQRRAQSDVARAGYLPSLTAQGVYTRNQYEAKVALPGGPTVTIQPHNGLDASFVLGVPLVNVGAWRQHRAAEANQAVAAAQRASTAQTVESDVTQAYYQLLGSEAVQFAAQKSTEVARDNLTLVSDRSELGTASQLDLQRAAADLARAEQDQAGAAQGVIVARRSLESLSRLTPEPARKEDYVEDTLGEEADLSQFLGGAGDELVAARPSALAVVAADRARAASFAAWFPTLAGQGQERLTNAAGFVGRNSVYTLSLTLAWRLDFALAPSVAVQKAAVQIAEARANKTRRAADDAIYRSWHQVRTGIEKARAARTQVKAATFAQELARERYTSGVATQLEVVQAQRDFFSAAVAQAQADFDLQYARAMLRIASRRAGETGAAR